MTHTYSSIAHRLGYQPLTRESEPALRGTKAGPDRVAEIEPTSRTVPWGWRWWPGLRLYRRRRGARRARRSRPPACAACAARGWPARTGWTRCTRPDRSPSSRSAPRCKPCAMPTRGTRPTAGRCLCKWTARPSTWSCVCSHSRRCSGEWRCLGLRQSGVVCFGVRLGRPDILTLQRCAFPLI